MYEPTQLFWYKILFLTELLIAESLFMFRLKYRNKIALRFLLSTATCYGFAFAFPIASYSAAYSAFMFLSIFAVTVITMKFCFKEPWINIVFCGIAGYTTQHIAFQVYRLIGLSFISDFTGFGNVYGNNTGWFFDNVASELSYFFSYIIIYFVSFILFSIRIKRGEIVQLKNVSLFILVSVVVIMEIVLSLIITIYSNEIFERVYLIAICLFGIICSYLLLTIQFEVSFRNKLKSELKTSNLLRNKEKKQYQMSKEYMDLINRKSHDLRHQIRQIDENGTVSKKTLSEMEKTIAVYDSLIKTGKEAVDVILSEKSLFCNNNGILLSCIVDGSLFDFMEEEDIYSLFGNILDNAIDAVMSIDGDKKFIGLTVKKMGDLLTIHEHNYFDNELVFINKIPLTTKANKDYHGYGMKSIQSICDKYNGELSIHAQNGIFHLNIIFTNHPNT